MTLSTSRHHLSRSFLTALTALPFLAGCGLFISHLPSGKVPQPAPHHHFIDIDGDRWHYESYPGTGETVVLLHGFASSTYTWKDIVPALQTAGHRVLALDMKGFGWSDKPAGADYSPKALMEGVNAWMDRLDLENVVFVGNSLGGALALMLTMDHPGRIGRLVLIDAAGYPIDKPFIIRVAALPVMRDVAGMFFSRWMVRHLLEEVFYDAGRVTPDRVDAYYDRMRTQGALQAQMALSETLSDQSGAAYVARIPDIGIPTLIIWGAADPWIPLANGERFHREIAGSQLLIIPRCGHVPQEEVPDVTADAITAFIDGRELPRPPKAPNAAKRKTV